jgi:hypothetical protein
VCEPSPLVCCLNGIWVHAHTIREPNWPRIWEFWVPYGVEMMPLQMVEADIHLRPFTTSTILDMFIVFEPLVWCCKGIWVHPYHSTCQVGPGFGNSVCLRSSVAPTRPYSNASVDRAGTPHWSRK